MICSGRLTLEPCATFYGSAAVGFRSTDSGNPLLLVLSTSLPIKSVRFSGNSHNRHALSMANLLSAIFQKTSHEDSTTQIPYRPVRWLVTPMKSQTGVAMLERWKKLQKRIKNCSSTCKKILLKCGDTPASKSWSRHRIRRLK